MNAYIFTANADAPAVMLPDLKSVRQKIRTVPKPSRDWARITLEDFPSDKEAFIAAWNCRRPAARKVLKKYRIGGPRGGRLIEMSVDEE